MVYVIYFSNLMLQIILPHYYIKKFLYSFGMTNFVIGLYCTVFSMKFKFIPICQFCITTNYMVFFLTFNLTFAAALAVEIANAVST